jgi:hypothetical protein
METDMTALPKYAHWEATGTFKIAVVGTSYYRDEIASIAQNPVTVSAMVTCLASLILDNRNPGDANAVRIVIDRRTVGYLPKEFAKSYRSYIADLPGHIHHVSAAAAITNGLKVGDNTYDYTIELDIPDSLRMFPLSAPLSDELIRVNGYAALQQGADGSYTAKVWVPIADFNELHKSREVVEWTTASWDTVNFYASNRQGIGLGFKVFQLPKPQYAALFKDGPTSASILLQTNRFATLRIESVT